MKLAATLHHPNGDVMETVFAMDYEDLHKFLVRMAKRWNSHINAAGRKMCVGVADENA